MLLHFFRSAAFSSLVCEDKHGSCGISALGGEVAFMSSYADLSVEMLNSVP